MRRATVLLLITALLAVLPTCTLFPSEDEGSGTIYGLFVGISQYADPSIPDLNVSHRDAIDMYGRLSGFRDSWDAGRMVLLTNASATKSAIRSALEDLVDRAGSSDTVLFFYSGHGFAAGDTGRVDEWDGLDEYIAPTDSINQPGNVSNDISDDELADWLAGFDGRKIVIIDACFSGGFIPGEGGHPAMTVKGYLKGGSVPKAVQGARFRSHFQDIGDGSTVIMTAAREDQLSWEVGALGHSAFTWYLYEGLGGPADSNGNGSYAALEVFNYAVDRTSAVAPQDPVLRGPAGDTLIAW